MKVPKNYLLLIAGLVWGAAGFNILRLGLIAYPGRVTPINILLSAAVYFVFQLFIFGKMVRKHTVRISGYRGNQFFLKFFDVKSFCIMAFMITFGITLRSSKLCPPVFIAVFYTGLGASLSTAGILFLIRFAAAIKELRGVDGGEPAGEE